MYPRLASADLSMIIGSPTIENGGLFPNFSGGATVVNSRPASCCIRARLLAVPRSFVQFGLTANYRLTTALARLRERGDREAVDEGFADLQEENNPSPPAAPYPLPSERAVINCGPAVNPNVETQGLGFLAVP